MLSNEKSKCNSFTHKMVIQLDVFATSMKHWIYYHVKSTYVIIIKSWCRGQRNVKILKNKLHPCEFSYCICHGSIFRFGARLRNCMMLFCTPRDEISSKKCTVSSDGSSCSWTSCPICIRESTKIKCCIRSKTDVNYAFDIS